MEIKTNKRILYDIHMHAFNLSHAGLIAYINRSLINKGVSLNDLIKKRFFFNLFTLLFYKSGEKPNKKDSLSLLKCLKFVLLIICSYLFIEGWAQILKTKSIYFQFNNLFSHQYFNILLTALIICIISFVLVLRKRFFKKIKNFLIFVISVFIASIIIASIIFIIVGYLENSILIKEEIFRIIFLLWVFISFLASVIIVLGILFIPFIIKFSNKTDKDVSEGLGKALNLFAFMENDIGTQFSMLEDELIYYNETNKSLKSVEEIKKTLDKSSVKISGYEFSKVIITPLVMDFGYKGKDDFSEVFYNTSPKKPILSQLVDLYVGIGEYNLREGNKLFEIYPFMGINPSHYSLSKEEEEKTGNILLSRVLNKYFSDELINNHNEARHQIFKNKFENMKVDEILSVNKSGTKKTHSTSDNSIYKNLFIGIKLYPPLGFNPWPENEPEKNKNRYLYGFCEKMQIPITTHCNNGGWTIAESKNVESFTNPDRWNEVLDEFPLLKINFAHFGGNGKGKLGFDEKRQKAILNLIGNYENVYADISCIFDTKEKYSYLYNLLEKESLTNNKNLSDRIIYGSDFPMILSAQTRNYTDYLKVFLENSSPELVNKLSYTNSLKFLWG